MTEQPHDIDAVIRGILDRGGVFMSRRGPVGPEQIERQVLSQVPRDEAIDDIVRKISEGEEVS